MNRSRVLPLVPAGAMIAAVSFNLAWPAGAAAAPKTFRQATAKDFEEGEMTGSSVLPAGEVVPGLVTTRIAAEAAFVWCATQSRDGATTYFGTGDDGRIFAVPTHGGASDKAGARRLATLDAAWVTALVTRADGSLLAGTTPGGRVFVVDPKNGSARLFGSIGAGHVWAMVRDDKAGITYVGSGAPGKIFALDDHGKSRQLWDSGDKHVVSLMKDTDGTLLAGTSEDAILYRVHVDGRAEALQDFEAEEVRSIVRAPSGLYVAVNDFEKGTALPSPPGPLAAKGTKIVLATGGPPASAGSLPRPGTRKSKAAVYWIDAAGRIEQVFALPDGYLTALAVAEDGSVFAAAGTQGHVYRVRSDRTTSLVIDLAERQALTLVRSGGELLVGTGDVGGIYRARAPAAPGGRYLSKVLDAEFPARWGMLRWLGSEVGFETRSGNTAKPGAGWSAWKALEGIQPGPSGGAGHVPSPNARYVQYRATLAGANSRLRGVTMHYLPQNQRARVTELTLTDAPAAISSPGVGAGTPTTPRAPHGAVLKLRWKVDNPDGDEMIYRLAFREQSEAIWRPLAGMVGDALAKPEYDWNTDGIPDGLYVVRVAASDERAQPRDRALTATFDSPPLLVDNRKPEVLDLGGRFPVLTGRARDNVSPVTQIEFAIDGGDWQLVSPTDGIADELVEPFSLRLPTLSRGPHAVAVRATDSADNVGAAQIVVNAP